MDKEKLTEKELHAEIGNLLAECDGWKETAVGARKSFEQAEKERDEWKAKYEELLLNKTCVDKQHNAIRAEYQKFKDRHRRQIETSSARTMRYKQRAETSEALVKGIIDNIQSVCKYCEHQKDWGCEIASDCKGWQLAKRFEVTDKDEPQMNKMKNY